MARDLRLTKYRQELHVVHGPAAYDVKQYAGGVAPVLVAKPTAPAIVTQTGSATAMTAKFVAPSPLYPSNLIDQPQETSTSEDGFTWVTTWTYVMAIADADLATAITGGLLTSAAKWPSSPTFVTP